ncbi:ABC transporter permease [Rhizobium sp. Root1220]|uniref:ABC transporter permease n=1 Tax=Rhizobium sp. Root1220 TaxID=1736432 RepID=UPI0006FB6745|nr:ABC transporter permease [Rhizobium sp. Root1220]KQV73258.1 peptide ABC transporter permease [Rhizobium sp. Root1220]
MLRFALKRVSSLLVVLVAMSFIVFSLQRIVPSDPARILAGPTAPTAAVDTLRERLGLNAPILAQYWRFIKNLGRGDLGTSLRTRNPVTMDLVNAAPASIELSLAALSLGTLIAGLVTVVSVVGKRVRMFRLSLLGFGSAPVVLTSLLLIYVFWFELNWFPSSGRIGAPDFQSRSGFLLLDTIAAGRIDLFIDVLKHLALPAIALALPIAVALCQTLTASLYGVMQEGFILTARGKGLGPLHVLLFHGLRNSASAPIAMFGLQVRLLLGGLLVVERVFAWPGIGLYMVQSFNAADLPAILGMSLALGAFYIVVSAMVELAQAWADPRISV